MYFLVQLRKHLLMYIWQVNLAYNFSQRHTPSSYSFCIFISYTHSQKFLKSSTPLFHNTCLDPRGGGGGDSGGGGGGASGKWGPHLMSEAVTGTWFCHPRCPANRHRQQQSATTSTTHKPNLTFHPTSTHATHSLNTASLHHPCIISKELSIIINCAA